MTRVLRNSGLLVVVIAAVLAESLRVSFPLLAEYAGEIGFTTAAAVVPALFAIGLVAAPLGAAVGARTLLAIGVVGLAAGRVVMQVQATPGLWVTLATVLFGFVALATGTRVASSRVGPLTTASSIFLGLALDTAIRLALTTWDAAWQHAPLPWAVGTLLPLALVVLLVGVLRAGGVTSAGRPGRAGDVVTNREWGADVWWWPVLLGLVLALQTLIFSNPSYVAAATGVGLPTAGAVVLIGLGLAAATPLVRRRWIPLAWLAVIATAAALSGPTALSGWPVPIAVLVGQVALGAMVAAAASRADQVDTSGCWRTGLGAGLSGLSVVLILLPYQISYDLDALRDIPQVVWPTLAAVLIVAIVRTTPAVVVPPRRISKLRWASAMSPVLLLAVPSWLALTWPDVGSPATDVNTVRVATYNLHYSIDEHGRLDPEQIAQVLEEGDAEVVMLQEVVRGWPIGGGLDAASWLSRRLGMEFAYGEAAEDRFGNVVMADRPILDSWSDTMDRGDGPMQRGYVAAVVAVGEEPLNVWSLHLQHRDDTTATRHAQAGVVLADWGGRERSIIGGDLNSAPGEPDLEPWFDGTGLISAEETAAGTLTPTAPARDPVRKIDWILGSPDLIFVDADVPLTLASDHLPVFATVVLE